MATAEETKPAQTRTITPGEYEVLVQTSDGWNDNRKIRVTAKNVRAAATIAVQEDPTLAGQTIWPVRVADRTTFTPKVTQPDPVVEL